MSINLKLIAVRLPVPDFIIDATRQNTKVSNYYYDQPKELIEALGQRLDVSQDRIYLTAGISLAITQLAMAFGKETHIYTPTYIGYGDAGLLQGNSLIQHNALKGDEYVIVPEELPNATLFFVCKSNNPFGSVDNDTIAEIAQKNPQAIVAVDEAYAGFTNDSALELTDRYSNVVIMRSFSKDYGLAGLRIGYIVAAPEILGRLISFENMWANVSYASVAAATEALKNEDYFTVQRAQIMEDKQLTDEALRTAGFAQVMDSRIVSSVLRFNDPAESAHFVNFLNEKDILTNSGGGISIIGLGEEFVRVTTGTTEDMRAFREAIQGYEYNLS